ncbi:hypothetical protein VNO77_27830 [Canavalia gladiata]|uniref:BHLH domain-containing protein n=1 Tax=Canavalia gladiata TaxID=3824 RepID=A0AAN9KVD2_CANGL
MSLSTYLNWDTVQIPNSELNTHELVNHLFPNLDEGFYLSNTLFDNYFDPTYDFLYPSEIYLPHHFTSYYEHDQVIPTEDYNLNLSLLPCPKRQKCSYEEQEQYPSLLEFIPSNFLDGFAMSNINNNNCCFLQEEEFPREILFPALPEFKVPQHGTNCVDLQCEKMSNERTVSAQSIAARERRRKITEKTQELGKLVPGGPKMNTAEMLHAAAKYVKYLQAQVGMLQLMNTLKDDKATPPTETLHSLVVYPFVQEKLYSEERCFVPKDFVTTLTNHEDVQSRPTLLKDLKEFIGNDIEKKTFINCS